MCTAAFASDATTEAQHCHLMSVVVNVKLTCPAKCRNRTQRCMVLCVGHRLTFSLAAVGKKSAVLSGAGSFVGGREAEMLYRAAVIIIKE